MKNLARRVTVPGARTDDASSESDHGTYAHSRGGKAKLPQNPNIERKKQEDRQRHLKSKQLSRHHMTDRLEKEKQTKTKRKDKKSKNKSKRKKESSSSSNSEENFSDASVRMPFQKTKNKKNPKRAKTKK